MVALTAASENNDLATKGIKAGVKIPFEDRERLHKSEIVNAMQHQRTAERAKPGLNMAQSGPTPGLQWQNATTNVHQGSGPQLHRQNASRKLTK